MNTKVHRVLLAAFAFLLFTSLACNFPAFSTNTAKSQPTPIPVTTQAVEEMQQELDTAATQAVVSNTVKLEFTETQLTSLAALELKKQDNPPLKDPQVLLRDGHIEVQGNAEQNGISLPVNAVMTVEVQPDGSLSYNIISANVGPLPLPQPIRDELTRQVNDILSAEINPQKTNMVIDHVTIADGKMTVEGHTP